MGFYPVKEFKHFILLTDLKGNFYIFPNLNSEQLKHYGKPIRFYNCWIRYNLCGKKLKRIHLTCLTCKLRNVVSGKDPLIQQITIHQVWIRKDLSLLRRILCKKFLSLAEAFS